MILDITEIIINNYMGIDYRIISQCIGICCYDSGEL